MARYSTYREDRAVHLKRAVNPEDVDAQILPARHFARRDVQAEVQDRQRACLDFLLQSPHEHLLAFAKAHATAEAPVTPGEELGFVIDSKKKITTTRTSRNACHCLA